MQGCSSGGLIASPRSAVAGARIFVPSVPLRLSPSAGMTRPSEHRNSRWTDLHLPQPCVSVTADTRCCGWAKIQAEPLRTAWVPARYARRRNGMPALLSCGTRASLSRMAAHSCLHRKMLTLIRAHAHLAETVVARIETADNDKGEKGHNEDSHDHFEIRRALGHCGPPVVSRWR